MINLKKVLKGGPGSGNHGHSGRPGERGGSGGGGGVESYVGNLPDAAGKGSKYAQSPIPLYEGGALDRSSIGDTEQIEEVNISDIKTEQPFVFRDGVKLVTDEEEPSLFRTPSGELVIEDGNHRVVRAIAEGKTKLSVRVTQIKTETKKISLSILRKAKKPAQNTQVRQYVQQHQKKLAAQIAALFAEWAKELASKASEQLPAQKLLKGGAGSGNFGHGGREGQVGGSDDSVGGGASAKEQEMIRDRFDDMGFTPDKIDLPREKGVKSENPKVGFGDCTNLALKEHLNNGSDVYVGYALPQERFDAAVDKHKPGDWSENLNAFPHAWNVKDGKIVDRALGTRWSNKHVYIGGKVPQESLAGIKSDTELTNWKKLFAAKKISLSTLGKITPDAKAKKIMRQLNVEGLVVEFMDKIQPAIKQAYKKAGIKALAQFDMQDDRKLVTQLDQAALDYARNHAAELVGMKYNSKGKLVPNPNAVYQITSLTRDSVQRDVSTAVENGWSADELATAIEDNYAFSEARASAIARTELAFSHVQGNVEGWKQTGLVEGKRSILGDLHAHYDECDENADAGVIGIDDAFPSGDLYPPYHPNCVCDVIPELIDGAEKILGMRAHLKKVLKGGPGRFNLAAKQTKV